MSKTTKPEAIQETTTESQAETTKTEPTTSEKMTTETTGNQAETTTKKKGRPKGTGGPRKATSRANQKKKAPEALTDLDGAIRRETELLDNLVKEKNKRDGTALKNHGISAKEPRKVAVPDAKTIEAGLNAFFNTGGMFLQTPVRPDAEAVKLAAGQWKEFLEMLSPEAFSIWMVALMAVGSTAACAVPMVMTSPVVMGEQGQAMQQLYLGQTQEIKK